MRIYKFSFSFLFILIVSSSLHAQEFNEAYLASLPEDIKRDILEQKEAGIESEKEIYRSSKLSSKLQKDEELIILKARLEADLLELEKRLANDEIDMRSSSELEMFGKNFFDSIQTSFMPINEPNLDADYILDYGDEITIQLIGQKNDIESFLVNRDGSVNIKEIGVINLAGLPLNDAAQVIKNTVKNTFIGTEAFITLTNLRDVSILVSGNAENPGIYTLSGNSNLLHALLVAGGVNELGSYRVINLIRNGEIIDSLDLYDILIDGDYSLSKRLNTGDIVQVEPIKKIVKINGAVKRPAIYELLDDENLDAAINYSNGLTHSADLKNIYLDRILDGTLKSLPIVNISQFDSIKANDQDLIYIRDIPFRTASINGAVLKPGSYVMAPGESIQDLIEKAGGFTANAYPYGAVFQNKDALLINSKAKDILYEEFLDNIIAISQQNISSQFSFDSIIKLTQDIRNSQPNGRIVIDLFEENESNIIKIQEGDNLVIPEKVNHVFIYGEVSTEGAVNFTNFRDLEYYVNKSGGYKKFADKEAIYILHPNGESQRYAIQRNLFANQPESLELRPGSIIFVPRRIDGSASRRLAAQAYVSILGNIGVALASLSALNNN